MDSPPAAQAAIYGDAGGPPMLYKVPRARPPARLGKRRKLAALNPPTEELIRNLKERAQVLEVDEKELSPGDLPGDFPKELAFRALAAYSLLRTLSVKLRLSPFTPTVFLRALYLPYPNKLLGQVHVALLRVLLAELGYSYKPKGRNMHKRRTLDNLRWPLRAGDNLTYLDGISWPLFYDDYCHLTADALWASYNDTKDFADMRTMDCTPAALKGYHHSNGIPNDGNDGNDSVIEYASSSADEERGNKPLGARGRRSNSGPQLPLKRSQRAGRNREYIGMDQSDSDSEFWDMDVFNEDDSDVEYSGMDSKKRGNHTNETAQSHSCAGQPPNDILNNPKPHPMVEQPYTSLPDAQPPGILGLDAPIDNLGIESFQDEPTGAPVMHIRGGGEVIDSTRNSATEARLTTASISQYHNAPVTWQVASENGLYSPVHHPGRLIGPRPTQSMSTSAIHPPRGLAFEPMGYRSGSAGPSALSQPQRRLLELQMAVTERKMKLAELYLLNYRLTQSRLGGAIAPFPVKSRRKAQEFEVEDEVAKTLRDFICGKQRQPSDVPIATDASSAKNSPTEFEQRVEKERWVHFDPLHELRSGVPYHRLSLEHKLAIMEFLIDQLLSVNDIVEALNKRRAMENCHSVPYGAWPMDEEFETLDNGDECGVCSGEGELLCCDGCVRSYHRECIDMSATEDLPEGKWLCPECCIVDPALFGPLGTGAKSSLEWFSISNVQAALRGAELLLEGDQQAGALGDARTIAELPEKALGEVQTELKSSESSVLDVAGIDPALAAADPPPNQEYLIVHGYIFCRSVNRKESSSSVKLLPRNVALSTIDKLDNAIKKSWPLVQVPTNEALSTQHFPTSKLYLLPIESYDPSCYKSKYLKAPVPQLLTTGGGSQARQMTVDIGSDCYKDSTSRLSDALTRDLSYDTAISKSLLSEPILYDPHLLFKEYLTRLESHVRKAYLLDEFWEAGTEDCPQEKWLRAVQAAKSINRLARLLLELIDRVNPKAFSDGWFQNHHVKIDEGVADGTKHFADLPSDWTNKKESEKRIWEKIAPDGILHVCERQGCPLDTFVRGIKQQITPSLVVKRGKRKRAKSFFAEPPSNANSSTFLTITEGTGPISAQNESVLRGDQGISDSNKTTVTDGRTVAAPKAAQNGLGQRASFQALPQKRSQSGTPIATMTRRSAGRMAVGARPQESHSEQDQVLHSEGPRLVGSTHEKAPIVPDSIDIQIDLAKRKKMRTVERIIKGSFQPTLAWPVAGRIPFPTMGNLPPREMRRLARNGGVLRAPYVAYQSAHEVGQVSFAHIWRKETDECKGHEELALQIRVLESFIDYQIFHSCEGIARRGKNQIQRVIKFSQRDPSSGILEHFVMSNKTMRGCWISSEHIDLSALIVDSFTRCHHQTSKRSEYFKEKKLKAEAQRKANEVSVRVAKEREEQRAFSSCQVQTTIPPSKALKANAARRRKSQAASHQGNHTAPSSDLSAPAHEAKSAPGSNLHLTHEARTWTEISSAIVKQHQLDLLATAKQCFEAGISVPDYKRSELRDAAFRRLQGIGLLNVPNDALVRIILASEEEEALTTLAREEKGVVNGHQFPIPLNVAPPPPATIDRQAHDWQNNASALNTLADSRRGKQHHNSLGGIFAPPNNQQIGVASTFPNIGSSQLAKASPPAEFTSAGSSTNDLLLALGQTMLGGHIPGPVPHQASMFGLSSSQQGCDSSVRRNAPPFQPQPQNQFFFEQGPQQYPTHQHQHYHQPQFNQFWGGGGNTRETERFFGNSGGHMGQQTFRGPVPNGQELQIQLLQQFQMRQQQQNPQFRSPSHPDNNGFW